MWVLTVSGENSRIMLQTATVVRCAHYALVVYKAI